jgi:hypothetical protein
MSELDDFISSQGSAASAQAYTTANDNPDDGLDALALSHASGVPAQAVYDDLPAFRQKTKAQMASDIVRNNKSLTDWVNSNPFASIIANNDYGNLDQLTRHARTTKSLIGNQTLNPSMMGFNPDSVNDAISDSFKSAFQGNLGDWITQDPAYKDKPITAGILGVAGIPFELAARTGLGVLGAGIGAVTAGAGEAARVAHYNVFGDEATSQQFGRAVSSLVEMKTFEAGHDLPEVQARAGLVARAREIGGKEGAGAAIEALKKQDAAVQAAIDRGKSAYQAGRQWYDNNLEPPVGVHPFIDEMKQVSNANALQELNRGLDLAQQSLLREKDPNELARLLERDYGNSEMGISGRAVADLYGAKEPAPDDGLLGWVPGIEDQIKLAREVGEDVSVPIRDWLAKVDPALAAQLNDHLRVVPHGITTDEARGATVQTIVPDTVEVGTSGGVAPDYRPMVDSPMAAIRGSMGLEPMFSIGDRKLQLERFQPLDVRYGPEQGFHDFQLLDHKGNIVGALNISEQKGGKQLHVDGISGDNGFGPRDFGPSLMIDLAKQVAAEFPEADTLTGHRVSGARDKAGSYMQPSAMPVIDLNRFRARMDVGDVESIRQVLEGGFWNQFSEGIHGYVKEKFDPTTQAINDAVKDEFLKRVPRGQVEFVQRIRAKGNDRIQGVNLRRTANSLIMLATDVEDRMGVMHHEAIHALRQLFTDKEWMTLEQAAREGGWLDRFDINRKYDQLGMSQRLEESIAEAYRTWEAGKADVGPRLHPIFQKIKEFLDAIRKRINDVLGRPGTADDIFERVQSGEVGGREESLYDRMEREADPAEPAASMPPKAANEPDVFEQVRKPTYSAAVTKQKFDRFKDKDADIRSFEDWWKVAEQEHLGTELQTGSNPFSAAKEYSKGGKTTIVVGPTGKRTLYHDGQKIARDRGKDMPQFSVGPDRPAYADVLDQIRASGVGLDLKSFQAIQTAIHERYASDLQAAKDRAERQQKTEQTQTWKDNLSQTRKEVESQLRQRPDIAADLFFSTGDLFGRKTDKIYRIASDTLTEEQKASLPKQYYAKEGLPADQMAKLFGFTSVDSMAEGVKAYRETRGEGTAQEALGRLVRDTADRQMQEKFGSLENNIMEEAKDQALSEADVNILAQEMYAAASIAKLVPIDKDLLIADAKAAFQKVKVAKLTPDTFADSLARHAREAERALLNGDPAGALVAMQSKLYSAVLMSEARKFRTEKMKFDRMVKSLRKEKQPTIDPQYTNFIHTILQQIGFSIKNRTIEGMMKDAEARDAGVNNLEKFIEATKDEGLEVPVAPEFFDPKYQKNLNDMTVEGFNATNGTLKALRYNGRMVYRNAKTGETTALNELVGRLVTSPGLTQFLATPTQLSESRSFGARAKRVGSLVTAAHIKLEALFNRWDQYNAFGDWQQYALRPLIEGVTQRDAYVKEFAKRLTALDDHLDMSALVDNPLGFGDPKFPGNRQQLTRGQLRAIMLNTGSESNLTKMAGGYGKDPQAVLDWVRQAGTKEDWTFVQGIWDMFKDIKQMSDTMYRSMTGGVAAEDIPARAIKTDHGTFAGGYYPIIHHAEIQGKTPKSLGPKGLLEQEYFKASPPAGYTKARTGDIRPLAVDMNQMPGRIQQMLHDIALRPAITEVGKIFYDQRIQEAIRVHYGTEYRDLLIPYLRDVANAPNFKSGWQAQAGRFSEYIRQNMISTLVGFNPGTVLKHAPTAAIQSINEVGAKPFFDEVMNLNAKDEATGETNWDFAINKSLELQRRSRNWQETLGGASEQIVPRKGFDTWRANIIRYASTPVAFTDMLSAVPTWLAAYKKAIGEGRSEGDAIYLGDRAVRFAHGSSAITNAPAIMRTGSAGRWFTSVYNFYNHMMNKNMEIIWRSQEALQLRRAGDFDAAKERFQPVIGQIFAYQVFPALIGGMVGSLFLGGKGEKDKSWTQWGVESMAHNISANFIGVRDVVDAMLHKSDPQVGLLSTAAKEFTSTYRDFTKDHPLSAEHRGRLVQDSLGLTGTLFGVTPAQTGKWIRFLMDTNSGVQRPRNLGDYYSGFRTGSVQR